MSFVGLYLNSLACVARSKSIFRSMKLSSVLASLTGWAEGRDPDGSEIDRLRQKHELDDCHVINISL